MKKINREIVVMLALLCLVTAGYGELKETPLPPGMAATPDQEIYFPPLQNVEAGQWATYEQTVSGRSGKVEYTLRVLEADYEFFVLEARTKRHNETIIQKWKINQSDARIVDYWLNALDHKPRRLPILEGAANTELFLITDPVIEKTPDDDTRKWYNINTPAGTFKCWRATGLTKRGKSAESYLSKTVPLFRIVKQIQGGTTILLKAFGPRKSPEKNSH